MPRSEKLMLDVGGLEVAVSNPGKLFFPERGNTKWDLVQHYLRVGEPLLRAMGGRPVLLQRFPEGAGGPNFFQKRVSKSKGVPDWLQRIMPVVTDGPVRGEE